MIRRNRIFVTVLAMLALVFPANAAPDLGVATNVDCSIIKLNPREYRLLVTGYFQVSNDQNYKINGTRAYLKNFGGQRVRDTGLVAIAPTYVGEGTIYDQVLNFQGQSSLRDATFEVYNGTKKKGYATDVCTRNF